MADTADGPTLAQLEGYNSAVNIDLADQAFWAQGPIARDKAFAELRSLDKPVFVTEKPATAKRPAKGYWAIVRHADVVEVSKNSKVFSSEPGVTTPMPNPIATFLFGQSMVNMDNPRHGRLRNIVQRAFSPKNMANVDTSIERIVDRAVTTLINNKPDDFVQSVASQVPFNVIADMMGIPEHRRARILERTFQTTERAHADHALKRLRLPGKGTLAMLEMHLLTAKIAREYRRSPAEDIMSALSNTEIDGERLGYRDLGAFFNLLLVAGIETTRNETVHFLHLMSKHLDQRELLLSDFDRYIDGAIEEVIRYQPSIIQFRRHVTQPYSIAGLDLVPGDQVAIFLTSANRDETVFKNPDVFDITREPNTHVGFGAGGPHICLGKLVARREMRVLFRELFERAPNIMADTNPPWLASNFDNRILRLPFTI